MSKPTPTRPDHETVSLADEAGVRPMLTDTVFSLWGIVNNLTRSRLANPSSSAGVDPA